MLNALRVVVGTATWPSRSRCVIMLTWQPDMTGQGLGPEGVIISIMEPVTLNSHVTSVLPGSAQSFNDAARVYPKG